MDLANASFLLYSLSLIASKIVTLLPFYQIMLLLAFEMPAAACRLCISVGFGLERIIFSSTKKFPELGLLQKKVFDVNSLNIFSTLNNHISKEKTEGGIMSCNFTITVYFVVDDAVHTDTTYLGWMFLHSKNKCILFSLGIGGFSQQGDSTISK